MITDILPDFLIFTLAFVIAIGIIVTVHEFGHFWVARRMGVRVLRFSIGFGTPLWKRRSRDGVEYVVGAIPLGGYVKMLDEREGEVSESERHRAFNNAPIWRRSLIAVAGPAANFLFAVLAFWILFAVGTPGLRPILGEIAAGTPAAEAGLEREDTIVAVAGQETPTWEAAMLAMYEEVIDGSVLDLTVVSPERGRRDVRLRLDEVAGDLTEPGQLFPELGFSRWQPEIEPLVGSVQEGGPAERAGLRAGDRIVAVDGRRVSAWRALTEDIRAHPGETVEVTILRDGSERRLPVTLDSVESDDAAIGYMGVSVAVPDGLRERLWSVQRYGILEALGRSTVQTWEFSALTLEVLGRMVLGQVSLRNIQGPIGIAQYAGYSAAGGPGPFLKFLAIVSISIGVLNLLPIPVLDGGHLVYFLIEKVKGSPLSEAAMAFGQRIGIAMILLLMGLAFYNDILGLMGS